ncbi:MAG: hypothetical protein RAK18_05910 [Conexivisphaerales archaeon]|nr:hypothetical protein [Conexivisphaerales archaeon]
MNASQIDEKVLRLLAYEEIRRVTEASDEAYIEEPVAYRAPRASSPCRYTIVTERDLIDAIYGPGEYEIARAKLSKAQRSGIDVRDLVDAVRFREAEFSNLLRGCWACAVDFYRIYSGDDALVSRKVNTLGALLRANAVVPSRKPEPPQFMINVRAVELFRQHLNALAEEVYDRVGRPDNVVVAPILRDHLPGLESERGKIIITFLAEERKVMRLVRDRKGRPDHVATEEEYDVGEGILRENVVILLSPLELGYQPNDADEVAFDEVREFSAFDRETRSLTYGCEAKLSGLYNVNVEFNAIGDVRNLDKVEGSLNRVRLHRMDKTEYRPLRSIS